MLNSFPRRQTVKAFFTNAGLAIAACLLALGATPAAAQQVININALDSNGQQALSLGPGTYSVNLIGTANGGLYNAWNPWGVTTCQTPSSTCEGWVDDFEITYGGLSTLYYNSLRYDNDTDALAANQAIIGSDAGTFGPYDQTGITNTGGALMFTLLAPTTVTFSIQDNPYSDNSGGISLSLSSVRSALPEPGTWAMMLLGFAAIGIVSRRRRRPIASA